MQRHRLLDHGLHLGVAAGRAAVRRARPVLVPRDVLEEGLHPVPQLLQRRQARVGLRSPRPSARPGGARAPRRTIACSGSSGRAAPARPRPARRRSRCGRPRRASSRTAPSPRSSSWRLRSSGASRVRAGLLIPASVRGADVPPGRSEAGSLAPRPETKPRPETNEGVGMTWACANGHQVRDGMFTCAVCGSDDVRDRDGAALATDQDTARDRRAAAMSAIQASIGMGAILYVLGVIVCLTAVGGDYEFDGTVFVLGAVDLGCRRGSRARRHRRLRREARHRGRPAGRGARRPLTVRRTSAPAGRGRRRQERAGSAGHRPLLWNSDECPSTAHSGCCSCRIPG